MNKIVITGLFLLLVLPLVQATDTIIKITSEPNKFVIVRVFEAGSRTNMLQSVIDRRVDFNNQVTITHSSDVSQLDIEVYIKDKPNEPARHYKKYEGISAGGTFTATLPEGASAPASEPPLNDTNQTQPGNVTNSTNTTILSASSGITGNVVQEAGFLGKIQRYYLIAGVFLAIILVTGGIMIKKKRSGKNTLASSAKAAVPPKTPPGSEKDPREIEIKLKETERRLEQATREISRIKNQEQIKQLQKNIDAEQEQIRRLQQGFS